MGFNAGLPDTDQVIRATELGYLLRAMTQIA